MDAEEDDLEGAGPGVADVLTRLVTLQTAYRGRGGRFWLAFSSKGDDGVAVPFIQPGGSAKTGANKRNDRKTDRQQTKYVSGVATAPNIVIFMPRSLCGCKGY